MACTFCNEALKQREDAFNLAESIAKRRTGAMSALRNLKRTAGLLRADITDPSWPEFLVAMNEADDVLGAD